MNLLILGAPGAGKGTQGALLADSYGLRRIATGDLLREAVRRGTQLGQKAKAYMDAGELVPDDVIFGMIRAELAGDTSVGAGGDGQSLEPGGFLFDGFPRNVEQAAGLDALLEEHGMELGAVVVLDVPEEVLVKRLSGRRTCASCGASFNIYFDPPREAGACDRCDGPLTERPDDDAATVRRRLQVYADRTHPLIAHYRQRSAPVHHIDGDGPVDEIQAELRQVLRG